MNAKLTSTVRLLEGLGLMLLLSACASSSLVRSWRDPAYQGPPLQNVLIIGVSQDGATRRIFEDRFVARIRGHGARAVPSYTLVPEDGEVPEETVNEAVREAGADGVIITRLISVQQETAVVPGYSQTTVAPGLGYGAPMGAHRDFYGFYQSVWTTYQPPTVHRYQVVTLETNLWSVKQGRLVWSGLTQTAEGSNLNKDIDGLVQLITDALVRDQLL